MKKALTIKIDERVIEELRFLISMCPSLSINSFCEYVIYEELKKCFKENGFEEELVVSPSEKLKPGRKINIKQ